MTKEDDNVYDITREQAKSDGVINIDKEYTFYYDESNNFRKLLLKDGKLNENSPKHFSLCGIVKSKKQDTDPSEIFKNLSIPKNIVEIKAKHIFQNDFISTLKSKNLKNFLRNLLESNYLIHITSLNPLYYSIVDIVDSIDHEIMKAPENLFLANKELKDFVYTSLTQDITKTLRVLNYFKYPNIKNEDLCDFKKELLKIMRKWIDNKSYSFVNEIYEDFLNAFEKSKELSFIQDETDNILIENLYAIYSQKSNLYRISEHIFDEESVISPQFDFFANHGENHQVKNYNFLKSNEVVEIQISDILSNLFGKYFTFIHEKSLDELINIRNSLSMNQNITLDLIKSLIDEADQESKGFIYRITSFGEQVKHDYFMYGRLELAKNYIKYR
ncbi:MAG: DUF3800 domain-containing protein [Marinomonas sp.]|uniref:DUF3800 domain-containing protein n=1 Tax=Marinomonas sp. TaxID=1904862 RepID=UPI003C73959F